MSLYQVALVVHVVSSMLYLGHLVTAVFWKTAADRSGGAEARALVHDRLIRAGNVFIAPVALIVFVSGYAMVRWIPDNPWQSVGSTPFAALGLTLLFASLGLWYFGMRPLEVKMANRADECVERGEEPGRKYAAWSGTWVTLDALAIILVVAAAALMELKPCLWTCG